MKNFLKITLILLSIIVLGCEETLTEEKTMESICEKCQPDLDSCKNDLREAKRIYISNDTCDDIRRFYLMQIEPVDEEDRSSSYLFRFEAYPLMGRCFISDTKTRETYQVTNDNLEKAMFLNDNDDIPIPPMKPPKN